MYIAADKQLQDDHEQRSGKDVDNNNNKLLYWH